MPQELGWVGIAVILTIMVVGGVILHWRVMDYMKWDAISRNRDIPTPAYIVNNLMVALFCFGFQCGIGLITILDLLFNMEVLR